MSSRVLVPGWVTANSAPRKASASLAGKKPAERHASSSPGVENGERTMRKRHPGARSFRQGSIHLRKGKENSRMEARLPGKKRTDGAPTSPEESWPSRARESRTRSPATCTLFPMASAMAGKAVKTLSHRVRPFFLP
ncbi:hypothetical protein SDC9_109962 [bioreactor metagenome]|uniref:Uncharacterized protein n=1 Tax=bioreactor metagenome TaxID=1076179 RepID=A0A645BCM4_9ZZZZ